jgi:hypothetical protein
MRLANEVCSSYIQEEVGSFCWCLNHVASMQEEPPSVNHTSLLRCIFGNPIRPATMNPAWQTPTVVALAHAAYENRILPAGTLEPARLAVLADALEEAGCDNAEIINHCRQPGKHVRGCWVVDLLLGKE